MIPKEFLSYIEHLKSYAPIINVPIRLQAPQGRNIFRQTVVLLPTFKIPENSNLTLADWIPLYIKDPFYGINRENNVTILAGLVYFQETNDSITTSFRTAQALLNREGAIPDICLFPNYATLIQVSPYINGNLLSVVCPELNNEIWLLTRDTWKKYPNTLICTEPWNNLRLILK